MNLLASNRQERFGISQRQYCSRSWTRKDLERSTLMVAQVISRANKTYSICATHRHICYCKNEASNDAVLRYASSTFKTGGSLSTLLDGTKWTLQSGTPKLAAQKVVTTADKDDLLIGAPINRPNTTSTPQEPANGAPRLDSWI